MKSDKGVLVLINNYQGDRMSWDMAIEMAQAQDIKVEKFIINDDVSVPTAPIRSAAAAWPATSS